MLMGAIFAENRRNQRPYLILCYYAGTRSPEFALQQCAAKPRTPTRVTHVGTLINLLLRAPKAYYPAAPIWIPDRPDVENGLL